MSNEIHNQNFDLNMENDRIEVDQTSMEGSVSEFQQFNQFSGEKDKEEEEINECHQMILDGAANKVKPALNNLDSNENYGHH